MEGKNIILSVSFSQVFGIIEFLFIKILTKTVDLQAMRVTIMLRNTWVSSTIGWYNKIGITLSTIASAVNIKPSRKRLFSVFSHFSDEPVTEDDSMFATGKNESLIRYENVEYSLKI